MTTATKMAKAFTTSIDIPEAKRTSVVEILNARLADATDLKAQTKHAHWNVKGPQFSHLHGLFDQIAPHFDDYADLLAERAVQLGGIAHGTLRQVAAVSQLPEYDLSAENGIEHLKSLIKSVSKFASLVREAIDRADQLADRDTADLFTQISRQVDKDLWLLEAHFQS
jgi:starvation-inducible DNA-binding protein